MTSEPLAPHRFHILTALAGNDLHGSGIVRDVLAQTGDHLRLWPATLYGTLEELERDSLIVELKGDRRPEGTSERRRYYRITPVGKAVLQAEATRLGSMVDIAIDRLAGA